MDVEIWLFDSGDGVVWCDTPNPGIDADPSESTRYIRADLYDEMAQALDNLISATKGVRHEKTRSA